MILTPFQKVFELQNDYFYKQNLATLTLLARLNFMA